MKSTPFLHSALWIGPLLVFLIVQPATGACESPEAIFRWVIQELKIEQPFEMPAVRFVERKALAGILVQSNINAYRLWLSKDEPTQAEHMRKHYLDTIVGVFDPKTKIVYIGDFLPDCRRQAVMAHEFVHYFQHMTNGFNANKIYDQSALRSVMEFQAYRIENRFTKQFCESRDLPVNKPQMIVSN